MINNDKLSNNDIRKKVSLICSNMIYGKEYHSGDYYFDSKSLKTFSEYVLHPDQTTFERDELLQILNSVWITIS